MSTPTVPDDTGDNDSPPLEPGMTLIKPSPKQPFPVNLNEGHRAGWHGESDGSVKVSAADLKAAIDILDKHGRVIICGPPRSGKTRLADAVQKVFFRDRGFTPHTYLQSIHSCHSHLTLKREKPKKTIMIEDNSMGILRCSRDMYTSCLDFLYNTQEIWDRPVPHPDTYTSFLIITCYPHILREIQMLDEGAPVQLADPKVVLHLTQDPLHPALPWEPELQTYSRFLVEMMRHDTGGRQVFCAVLILTMEGWCHTQFLLDPPKLHARLQKLGFPGLTSPEMTEMAHSLRGFILAEDGYGFVSRFMYEAVGLALGRSYSVYMALLMSDAKFLGQFIRMDPDAKPNSTYLAAPENCDFPRRVFMEKLYKGFVEEAALMELCQHPSLAYLSLVKEFANYCDEKKNQTERVMSIVDSKHKLPLLYWSVWNSSTHLNSWCLTIMESDIRKTRVLTEPLLISLFACVLFAEDRDRTLVMMRDLVKSLIHHKFKQTEDLTLILPAPTLRKEAAKVRMEQVKTRMRFNFCFMELYHFPFPGSFVKVNFTEEAVTVKVPSRSWYLLLRLLTDQQVDEMDEKGNTALHLAAQAGHPSLLKMLVRSRASLMVRNKKGLTPHQVGKKRKHRAEKNYAYYELEPREGILHLACREGHTDMVKVLLCQGASLEDRDDRGDTPLHIACRQGHVELVTLLLQLKADVNARNVDKQTPVHEASAAGHNEVLKLLLQRGPPPVSDAKKE